MRGTRKPRQPRIKPQEEGGLILFAASQVVSKKIRHFGYMLYDLFGASWCLVHQFADSRRGTGGSTRCRLGLTCPNIPSTAVRCAALSLVSKPTQKGTRCIKAAESIRAQAALSPYAASDRHRKGLRRNQPIANPAGQTPRHLFTAHRVQQQAVPLGSYSLWVADFPIRNSPVEGIVRKSRCWRTVASPGSSRQSHAGAGGAGSSAPLLPEASIRHPGYT